MNYLDLVNDVLIRLREDEVTATTDTPYSKLIGKFVNDAKRIVEDSFQWNVLTETLTVTTADGLFNYDISIIETSTGEQVFYLEGSDCRSKIEKKLRTQLSQFLN